MSEFSDLSPDNISPSKDVMQFSSFAFNIKMDLSN